MNEVQVDLDDVGRVRLRRAGGDEGVYTLETTEALRAFFQAERDETLGRWRDPENPDWITYPSDKEDAVWVFNEREGGSSQYWTRGIAGFHDPAYTGYSASHYAADRYFQAHPEPKPWEKARPGYDEIWVLTIHGCEQPVYVDEFRGEPVFQVPGGETISLHRESITAGRRIWPEGEDK